MDSGGTSDGGGVPPPAVSGELKKICVMKVPPSLGSNSSSRIIYTPSVVPAASEVEEMVTATPVQATFKTVPLKASPNIVKKNNIIVKDGHFFVQCSKTNKFIKVQMAKNVSNAPGQVGEFKILTPINIKALPPMTEVKVIQKKTSIAETVVTKMPPLMSTIAPMANYNFKPIAAAPLTPASQTVAKPQPEATQVSTQVVQTAPPPAAAREKGKIGGIQITNLPTGTVLNFKGPSYDLNSIFPMMSKDKNEEKSPQQAKMINVQISNGQISDPDGPIKMLGISGKSLMVTRENITLKTFSEKKGEVDTEISSTGIRSVIEKTPMKQSRSSSVDESPPKKSPTPRRLSEPAREKAASMEEPPKLASLFCDESLDISSESEKSVKSPKHVETIVDPETLAMSDGYIDENERLLTPKSANCQLMKLNSRKEGEDEDPLNLIRWEDGVGYLYGSNIHFQFNEIGLVDIMDDDEYMRYQQSAETAYDRPIGERELNPTRMRQLQGDSKEPTYTCVSCMCFGTASDFLAPDYCSKVCLNASKKKTKVNDEEASKKKRKSGKDEKNTFQWHQYLESTNSQPAPDELFKHCHSDILKYYEKNPFRAQMKFEAIDPDNCSVFGVVTVLAVRGQRMLLHFDGSSVKYDFWQNFSSFDIFPPRWCEHEGKNLILPTTSGKKEKFVWRYYLEETQSEGAKLKNFRHLSVGGIVKQHGFEVGMKLEAENMKSSGNLTVATVADVIGNRLRIHFDANTEQSDYWCDFDSPRLHPINYHKTIDAVLSSPLTPKRRAFSWTRYIAQTRSVAAPDDLFVNRPPRGFRKGMKLEAVDRVCPEFIRPATVIDVVEYELRILYDGFETQYAYWVDDDSTDIFPAGYCEVTGHPLEAIPNTRWITQKCGLKVCSGRGSIHNLFEKSHETATECPYNMKNYNHRAVKPSRLNAVKQLVTDYVLRFSLIRKRKINVNPVVEEKPPQRPTKTSVVSQKRPRKTAHSVDREFASENRKMAKLSAEATNPPATTTASSSSSKQQSKEEAGAAAGPWSPKSRLVAKVEIDGKKQTNPLLWTTNEVATFLTNLPHFTHIAEEFRQHDIDGEAFLSLSKDDLTKSLSIKLGPAIKLYNLIVKLRSDIKEQFMQF